MKYLLVARHSSGTMFKKDLESDLLPAKRDSIFTGTPLIKLDVINRLWDDVQKFWMLTCTMQYNYTITQLEEAGFVELMP